MKFRRVIFQARMKKIDSINKSNRTSSSSWRERIMLNVCECPFSEQVYEKFVQEIDACELTMFENTADLGKTHEEVMKSKNWRKIM